MDYQFNDVEKKWRKYWSDHKTFKVGIDNNKPKFYVLDMFPYPSGAGLHVGHPLGYIASDIYARYKRLKGYNVLHPMGFDAYGLPAEQYAIQTGQHPAVTTANNIARYREQLDQMGFTYDWDREVRTCDPDYYHWTQWTFIQLFKSWYNRKTQQAERIESLVTHLEAYGTEGLDAACSLEQTLPPGTWSRLTEAEQQDFLMNYRLAYLSDTMVNWCPELGTVLANDEVREGYSVRGGHPVERKLMKQWLLRITAYAERLLSGLDQVDWSDSLKEMQRNWIGKSEGASVVFPVHEQEALQLEVFTTRPDTIFGATFMVVAPEHELLPLLTTPGQQNTVEAYVSQAKNRSERERMAEVKKISGEFTGSYAINPLSGEKIPVWVADYVLAGYGTGAIMAVPAHDSRDYAFARHFGLTIREVVSGGDISVESYDAKEGTLVNSDFINGLGVKEAVRAVISRLEETGQGRGTVNYRLRDAIFSRQRYWGEPFPVYYKDGLPYTLDEGELPLLLPDIDSFQPGRSGEAPLTRAKNWTNKEGYPLETNTMPGFAGSSGYYLRYMDPDNKQEYFSKEAVQYWQDVDLYIGGAEHATGHLIYARFWNKFLFDSGHSVKDEPFRKLVNQGMIQGRSSIAYQVKGKNEFVSFGLKDQYDTIPVNVDIRLVNQAGELDIEAFRNWRPDYTDAGMILEDGKFLCGHETEKMSKSLHNVVNPDELIEKYGADTFRLYEMFLGPIEQSKPWDTNGIEGVFRFIKKLWKLFHDQQNQLSLSPDAPTPAELKVLHRTIRKVEEDIERLSLNTVVSTFMICVNELSDLKCNKSAILSDLIVLISPFAPHIAEELWEMTGHRPSVANAAFPVFNPGYVRESVFEYPVSFNGKMRFRIALPLDAGIRDVESAVLASPEAQKWIPPGGPRKVIVVPGKIVNVVV
ncbi:MAG TPA: leucine--tRNA ligase [Bacteroidales bacterium]|nr:leucine--tRNA ligase [Bacteroidales bacterium]HSA44520.1 leucine--tRNA ligase [Bacteroidales bacterium]